MNESRPTSIFVIGLLHIVVGCIGVVWTGAATVSLLFSKHLAANYFSVAQVADMGALDRAMNNRVPLLGAYQLVVMQLVPWFLTGALLAGGVGLLRGKLWARNLSILYAVTSILHKLGMAVYTIAFLLPFYKSPIYVLEMSKPDLTPGAEAITTMTAIAVPLVLMAYAILVLVVMYRPAVVLAMTAQQPVAVQSPA